MSECPRQDKSERPFLGLTAENYQRCIVPLGELLQSFDARSLERLNQAGLLFGEMDGERLLESSQLAKEPIHSVTRIGA